MKNLKENEWLEDYSEFLNTDGIQVPDGVDEMTLYKIKKMMNPNALLVFLKVLGIHSVVGFLSLSVCHQFGMNPFNTEKSFSDWMMNIGGHQLCMFGCGVLFVSLTVLAAGYFLTMEEVRALKKTELLQVTVLGLISLGLFIAVGAELALGIAGLWLLGAVIGGFVATESVWRLKQI